MAANDDLFEGALRHQVDLRRYDINLRRQVLLLLEAADKKLVARLRDRLPLFAAAKRDPTGEKWTKLLDEIREMRKNVLAETKALAQSELSGLAKVEASHEVKLLNAASPIEYEFAKVATESLAAIVKARPFQGAVFGDWFKSLEAADQTRLVRTLTLGVTQGRTTDEIVRQVVGTKANNVGDGILSVTRREAVNIVRTGAQHVSNEARELVWEANSDVIGYLVCVATLDGRTSPGCRARDGKAVPQGDRPLPKGVAPLEPPTIRPPFHFGCRTTMVAVFDGLGLLGTRPTVTDVRTREKREIDFRAQARAFGRPIQEIRRDWATKNVGSTPSPTNYQEFLSKQPAKFQDEVLGKTKGKLFRDGNLTVDQFVDRAGNELNLAQLAEREPGAFRRAGLDPDIFTE